MAAIPSAYRTRLDYVPMYFVRSGFIYIPYGSLRFGSHDGRCKTASAYPASDNTYDFTFNPTGAYPANQNNRSAGVSTRYTHG